MFKRPILNTIKGRIAERRRFMQVIVGPRQTGKTTLARQLIDDLGLPSHYASADEPTLKTTTWIEQQWETARIKARTGEHKKALLVLDEVQKIGHWSEVVKRLWDEDTAMGEVLQVILLGSSPLLIQTGLTESLAGRCELIPVVHWSFSEMQEAFGWNVEQYIFYGGYPGSADLISNPRRWANYIKDSLIETTISRDILLMRRVDKPALLRRLFELGCIYSGQVLSFQKMLGQLQDAGNTTTLAHYLNLLEGAGLLMGLPKYGGRIVRQRASSPKLQVLNTALITAQSESDFDATLKDREYWGHLVESAIGATLANGLKGTGAELFYWRERNREIDYIIRKDDMLVAMEVKSGRSKTNLAGMDSFAKAYPVKRKLLIGSQGIALRDFFLTPPEQWSE
ncbi:MAG: ATP-binding protein [Syntrophales bacterium]|jgi:uncharacterized protein